MKIAELWPKHRVSLAFWAVVALVLAYIMASRAIDTGSLGQYGLTLVLIILFVRFVVGIFKLGNAKKR